ncbi:MAG: cysteine desulfurase [Lachnospiraceae bacterium]|nr:cysteine desulfurase [Lachnospiraceae bacterium]
MIYMDHAATSPVSEIALEEMLRCYREGFGNPSAIYSAGQAAKNALEKARARVGKALGAHSTEVFFTSGGTESDNWVLEGIARKKKRGHIITTAIEHNAVLRTAEHLEENGFTVTRLIPDHLGRILPGQLEEAIQPDTVLISIMTANNVVGTIQDIPALAKVARAHHVPIHTDAVQAVGQIPVDIRKLGVDYLSLSAHKVEGPLGVGALICRIPNMLPPLIFGGGQEKTRRSGTENVPGIVGMAAALEERVERMEAETAHLTALRDRLIGGLTKIPGVCLTGDPEFRLPGLASFAVESVAHSTFIVNALNERNVCVSSGSACSASSKEASHVLEAMGYDERRARCALRFSLGPENTAEEVEQVLEIMPAVIEEQSRKGFEF